MDARSPRGSFGPSHNLWRPRKVARLILINELILLTMLVQVYKEVLLGLELPRELTSSDLLDLALLSLDLLILFH